MSTPKTITSGVTRHLNHSHLLLSPAYNCRSSGIPQGTERHPAASHQKNLWDFTISGGWSGQGDGTHALRRLQEGDLLLHSQGEGRRPLAAVAEQSYVLNRGQQGNKTCHKRMGRCTIINVGLSTPWLRSEWTEGRDGWIVALWSAILGLLFTGCSKSLYRPNADSWISRSTHG